MFLPCARRGLALQGIAVNDSLAPFSKGGEEQNSVAKLLIVGPPSYSEF